MILACCVVAFLRPGPTWTLNAVGDVMLGRHIALRLANKRPSDAFVGVRSKLFDGDFVVGNLECALSNRPFAVNKQFLLRAPSRLASQLAGFSCLSLENNHSGDCGPLGVQDSVKALASAGVVGVSENPVFFEKRGLRLGVVAICDLDGYRHIDEAAIKKAVTGSDVAVALVHWGVEGSTHASEEQKSLALRLYRMGIKLILGSHPHVLQPSVAVGSDGVVAYSLGNFVFDVPFPKAFASERRSVILQIIFDKSGVRSVKRVPVWLKHGFPVLNQSHNATAHFAKVTE